MQCNAVQYSAVPCSAVQFIALSGGTQWWPIWTHSVRRLVRAGTAWYTANNTLYYSAVYWTQQTAHCTVHLLLHTLLCLQDISHHITSDTLYSTLHTTHYTLRTKHYKLNTTHYSQHIKNYILNTTNYTIHNTQYTIHNTQYTLNNTQYKIDNTQYTTHITQYTILNLDTKTHSTINNT